jgi:hypothetical protein
MKERIGKGWNFPRILFLLFGVFFMIQSVIEKQWINLLPGIYFAAMGLLGFGCAAGQCSVPPKKISDNIE